MNLAASESLLSGRPVAWTAQESAYRFWKFSEDMGWSALVGDVLRARTLPSGMTMANPRLEAARSAQQMRVEFGSYGATDSFSIEMALGSARCTVANSPDGEVRVLPDGGAGHENPRRG
jgi:general secretion pathway protein H